MHVSFIGIIKILLVQGETMQINVHTGKKMNAMQLTCASKTYGKRSCIPEDAVFHVLLQLQHLWVIDIAAALSTCPVMCNLFNSFLKIFHRVFLSNLSDI